MKLNALKQDKKYFIKDYDGFRKKFYEEMDYIYITYYYPFKNKKPIRLLYFNIEIGVYNDIRYCGIRFEHQNRTTRFNNKEKLDLFLSFFEEYPKSIQEEMDI